jgi:glycosyltransferase involved in cell wall biosynthesis
LPNPLDLKSLATIGIEQPYFLFVGTLEPRKNLLRLVNAYARIDEAIRNKFLMVIAGGKGWGGVDIHALVKEKGLSAQLVLTGYVNDNQLATLYAHARFLAMPSIYEGFGLPLVEAMSFGVPVLTSNCSSMPEVAGDAGLLVDPFDEKAIADALRSLLTDDHLRDTLAARARKNSERFSWQRAAAETMVVFEEAVAERRSRRKSVC